MDWVLLTLTMTANQVNWLFFILFFSFIICFFLDKWVLLMKIIWYISHFFSCLVKQKCTRYKKIVNKWTSWGHVCSLKAHKESMGEEICENKVGSHIYALLCVERTWNIDADGVGCWGSLTPLNMLNRNFNWLNSWS